MDKRTILAFVLIGLILILTQTEFYKKKVLPQRPRRPVPQEAVKDTLRKPELIENQGIKETQPTEKKVVIPETTIRPETRFFQGIKDYSQSEKRITISNALYRAVLSTKGGGMISWKLKQYTDSDSQLVELLPGVNSGQPTIGFVLEEDTLQFNQWNYVQQGGETFAAKEEIYLNEKKKQVSTSYYIEFQDGKRIAKTFTFYWDRYDFDLKIQLQGFAGINSDKSYQLAWNGSLQPTESPIRDDLGYYKIYAYLGEDLQDFNVNVKEEDWKIEEVSGSVNWAALRTKYFVSAIVPMDDKGRSILYKARGIPYLQNQRFKQYQYEINMPLNPGDSHVNQFRLYLGPLEYNKLKELDLGLEKLILSSSGYERLFRPFSIIILIAFKFLHNFISNYGLVIILFSILIKLVLYPLTHKSYISMKKMQLIQPMMTEMREKYKNDPQQLNKQMMKLYKDYGVNPMGGCLPMLLQMPLLIGLFIVFRSTIELRGADFVWWINDLSKPDSIFHLPFPLPLYGSNVGLLPLVMGVTMFFQQKSTMQDPRQKMMAYFMPIFFVFLFNSFPSGLNLYYTLFNIWSILQQKFIKTEEIELKPVKKKKEGRKKLRK